MKRNVNINNINRKVTNGYKARYIHAKLMEKNNSNRVRLEDVKAILDIEVDVITELLLEGLTVPMGKMGRFDLISQNPVIGKTIMVDTDREIYINPNGTCNIPKFMCSGSYRENIKDLTRDNAFGIDREVGDDFD